MTVSSHQRSSRTGVCSWSLPAGNPAELAQMTAAVGINAVQLALGPVVREPEVWQDATQVLARAGVDICSGMLATNGEDYSTLTSIARTGGLRQDRYWSDNLALARRTADVAAEMNIPLVTFHAGFLPDHADHPEYATMIDRVAQIADVFARREITVGLETGQETAQTLLAILTELKHPTLGVNFDPANMILYGKGDPVAGVRDLRAHVVQIHVKDAVASSVAGEWGREVPAGQGEVDWAAFFDVAHAIQPPVDFIIEREAGVDRLDDIRAARALCAVS